MKNDKIKNNKKEIENKKEIKMSNEIEENFELKATEEEKIKQESKKLTLPQKKELQRFMIKGVLVICLIGAVLIGVSVLIHFVG